MNVFFLDREPSFAAAAHCDKHVSKMIIEYAQLMSTAHHELDSPIAAKLYKRTHTNHPSAKWTRSNRLHYVWLHELWRELSFEYTLRYGKQHATWVRLCELLYDPPSEIPQGKWQDPPQCMPNEYKHACTVQAYRNYYHSKTFAVWNYTRMPEWFKQTV